MSSDSAIGVFEVTAAGEDEQARQQREAAEQLEAASYNVREVCGSYLFAAKDVADFRHRVAVTRKSAREAVQAAGVHPGTGIMRRISKKLEREFTSKLAEKTKALEPEGDFKGYLNSVDSTSEKATNNVFVPTEDTDEHTGDPAQTLFVERKPRHEAARKMARDIIAHFGSWCEDRGVKPSLNSLDRYAAANNAPDEAYFTIASALQRSAAAPMSAEHLKGVAQGKGGLLGLFSGKGEQTKSEEQPRKEGGRRTAAPDYLQKADQALTDLLNQRAQEFQETIAPLQQALMTVQQAEAEQQAANPFNPMPGGQINVMPPGTGAPGTDPSMGGGDPMMGGGGDPMAAMMGGGDPMMGGGAPPADPMGGLAPDPSALGGDPSGGIPPELAQMMMGSRRRADKSTDDFYTYNDRGGDPEEAERNNRGYSDVGKGMVQDWETGDIFPDPRRKAGGRPKAEARKGAQGITAADVVQKFEEWNGKRPGLPTGTEVDVDQFVTENKVGPRAVQKLKKHLTGKQREAARREAFWESIPDPQHKVAGWEWDDYQNAYRSDRPREFECSCGQKVAAVAGFHRCACGKQWNSYVIGTGGDRREASAEKYLVREIPTREGVIVAARDLTAGEDCDDEDDESESEKPWEKEATREFAQFVAEAFVARESAIHKLTEPGELTDGEDPGTADMKQPPADWARRNPDGKWNNGPRRSLQ